MLQREFQVSDSLKISQISLEKLQPSVELEKSVIHIVTIENTNRKIRITFSIEYSQQVGRNSRKKFLGGPRNLCTCITFDGDYSNIN